MITRHKQKLQNLPNSHLETDTDSCTGSYDCSAVSTCEVCRASQDAQPWACKLPQSCCARACMNRRWANFTETQHSQHWRHEGACACYESNKHSCCTPHDAGQCSLLRNDVPRRLNAHNWHSERSRQ
eukprot:4368-Heterococcus_DN1.PRE.3